MSDLDKLKGAPENMPGYTDGKCDYCKEAVSWNFFVQSFVHGTGDISCGKRLIAMPTRGARQKVYDALTEAIQANFDEVVILGFKDRKTYLLHSKITSEIMLVGAIESMKVRMMNE